MAVGIDRLAGLVWAGLACMLVAGCRGTEQAVFEAVPSAVVAPPPAAKVPKMDPSDDAGAEPVVRVPKTPLPKDRPDAGGHKDAGNGPDPNLDENAVFSWKESLPGQGTCRVGRYAGVFTCESAGASDPSTAVHGALTFTLSGSPEDPRPSISVGWALSSPLRLARSLTGMLDCVAKHFVATTSVTNASGTGGTGAAVPSFRTPLDAALDGVFDDQTLLIQGTFTLSAGGTLLCSGTFSAGAIP